MGIMDFNYTNLSLTGIIVFITAFLIGMKYPDWDFKMKLRHRNILTHSPFILFIFQRMYLKNPGVEFRYFIMGFSLAIGIHLIFDIFPKGWGGGAMLQTPIIKYSFKKNMTKTLLFIFILISFGITIRSTTGIEEVTFLFLFGTLMIIKDMVKEEKILRPMSMYTVLMVGIASIKYQEVLECVSLVYTIVQKTVINLL